MKQWLRKLFYGAEIFLERARGVDFTVEIDAREENHTKYAASTPLIHGILKEYFSRMNIGGDDSILDVGCGKGRMIYFFSRLPFGKVGGVEYEEDIYRICRNNLSKLNVYRVSVSCADAAKFDGYDEYNWFYAFNPFSKDIMQGFIDRLKESKDRKDRNIRVVYFNPTELDMFIENGFCIDEELPHRIVVLSL